MSRSGTLNSCHPLTDEVLLKQNQAFDGTAGVSENNRVNGFRPAFMDTDTGNVYLSQYADGQPAPVHVLDGLPLKLIDIKSTNRCLIKSTVVSGFLLGDRFYTRERAARASTL